MARKHADGQLRQRIAGGHRRQHLRAASLDPDNLAVAVVSDPMLVVVHGRRDAPEAERQLSACSEGKLDVCGNLERRANDVAE
jgi:hypothetical protein